MIGDHITNSFGLTGDHRSAEKSVCICTVTEPLSSLKAGILTVHWSFHTWQTQHAIPGNKLQCGANRPEKIPGGTYNTTVFQCVLFSWIQYCQIALCFFRGHFDVSQLMLYLTVIQDDLYPLFFAARLKCFYFVITILNCVTSCRFCN